MNIRLDIYTNISVSSQVVCILTYLHFSINTKGIWMRFLPTSKHWGKKPCTWNAVCKWHIWWGSWHFLIDISIKVTQQKKAKCSDLKGERWVTKERKRNDNRSGKSHVNTKRVSVVENKARLKFKTTAGACFIRGWNVKLLNLSQQMFYNSCYQNCSLSLYLNKPRCDPKLRHILSWAWLYNWKRKSIN